MDTTTGKDFKDLYEYFQSIDAKVFKKWLEEEDGSEGGYRQEAALRLFAAFQIIPRLREYCCVIGKYDKGPMVLEKPTQLKELFENSGMVSLLRGDRGVSDCTLVHKTDSNKILAISSKKVKNQSASGLDLSAIKDIAREKYQGYTVRTAISVPDKKNLLKKAERCNEELWEKNIQDSILVDNSDLMDGFMHFKENFNNKNWEDAVNKKPEEVLKLLMHQSLHKKKALVLIDNNPTVELLIAALSRSGKSYTGAGIIDGHRNLKDRRCDYLIITTAKNETMKQWYEVFNYANFTDCKIHDLNANTIDAIEQHLEEEDKHNIIIVSADYLKNTTGKKQKGNKIKKIKWLKKLSVDIIFLDEAHKGGCTPLAREIMKYYGSFSAKVFITATFGKPKVIYNIKNENILSFNQEDVMLCKDLTKKANRARLVVKHGPEIEEEINGYDITNLQEEYRKYPEHHCLTVKLKNQQDIKEECGEDGGWSPQGCQLTRQSYDWQNNTVNIQNEFQDEDKVKDLWQRIGIIPEKQRIPLYRDNYMKRMEKIARESKEKSRWLTERENPMVIMAFLPAMHINETSEATKKLIEKYTDDWEIVCTNTKVQGIKNAKQRINNAEKKAKDEKKKGVIVLTGTQCHLGVTIDECDIVILLNNNEYGDMIKQMIYRCMSKGKGKTIGFVIDMNWQRSIANIVELAHECKPNLTTEEGIKYILSQKLITLNADEWLLNSSNPVDACEQLAKAISKYIYI